MKVKTILAVVVLGFATTTTVNQSQDLADAASSIGSATREYEAGKQARDAKQVKIDACIAAGTAIITQEGVICRPVD
jgi:Flp pilus assembly protein TadG